MKANAGSNIFPDNETLTNEVNEGHVELGVINHYYWYRQRAEVGADAMHSAIATFAPRDPGYVIDVSGAGIINASTHKSAAQQFWPSWSAVRVRRSWPTATASSIPWAPGSPPPSRSGPSTR